MKKKNSRKLKKKIEALKDLRKIKEISFGGKKEIKEIKEIKEDKEESESIEESEDFSNLEFSESPKFSPVLERVAVQRNFGELEQEVGFVPTTTGNREEDEDLKYNEASKGNLKYASKEGSGGGDSSGYRTSSGSSSGYETGSDNSGIRTIDESNLTGRQRKIEGLITEQTREEFLDPLGENRLNRERNIDLREVQAFSNTEYKEYESDKKYDG